MPKEVKEELGEDTLSNHNKELKEILAYTISKFLRIKVLYQVI